jgi:tripartite-type tricarboxylate transporter receptor subunit TctC
MIHRRTALAAVAAAALAPAAASADTWPTRPLRLIVPFPPGSASDILARSVAARMAETLGQAREAQSARMPWPRPRRTATRC